MKIVMVTMALPPHVSGVVTSTVNLARQLAIKHSVTIVAGTAKKEIHQQQVDSSLTYLFMPGMLVKDNLAISYLNLKKMEEAMSAINPDVIHLHDIGPLCFSALAAARKMKIPVIITHHFTAELIFKTLIPSHVLSNRLSQNVNSKQFVYDLVKSLYNYCQLVVVPSTALIPYFKKARLKPPIVAISNGIITANFRRRQSKAKTLKQFGINHKQIILSVGRLDMDKSLHLLVEAFSAIHLLNPEACLIFVGQGNQLHKLKLQVRRLNLEGAVYFLGQIDNQSSQLSYLYNIADVFVNPSIIESQGMVFLEALAAGAPIVAVDNPVLDGMIEHLKHGLLIPPNNAGSLAAAIQKILSDSHLKKQMSAKNRRQALHFDVTRTAKLYLEAYEKALRHKRRA